MSNILSLDDVLYTDVHLSDEPVPDCIVCPVCGEQHKIEYGDEVHDDGTVTPSKLLAFYKCNGRAYVAGVRGKLIKTDTPIEW